MCAFVFSGVTSAIICCCDITVSDACCCYCSVQSHQCYLLYWQFVAL